MRVFIFLAVGLVLADLVCRCGRSFVSGTSGAKISYFRDQIDEV